MPSRRPLLPRSLFGRALLILIVPIVVLQLVVGIVFFQRHYQRVTDQMTHAVATELAYLIDRIERLDTAAAIRAQLAGLEAPLDLRLTFRPGAALTPGIARERTDLSGLQVAATLAEILDRPFALDLLTDSRSVSIAVAARGGVLEAEVPRSRMTASNPHQLLVLMLLTALLLGAVAVIFLRNQIRPIRKLAEAAEAFGKGRSEPFRPAGAEEVRRAGAAFLSMRARIERQIEQRTAMLSGVSHDLRTPLTRIKLTLAMLEDTGELHDLQRDVDAMERMLAEFLAFARGTGTEEPAPTDPVALAERVVTDARRAGAEITLAARAATPDLAVALRPGAVTRALSNLVANAVRHGTRVAVSVRLMPRSVDFIVEDDGPGIPEPDRARALAPFTRLDPARHLDATDRSVGLGLTIALDIARTHGGSLELATSPTLGGLRATLRLPR